MQETHGNANGSASTTVVKGGDLQEKKSTGETKTDWSRAADRYSKLVEQYTTVASEQLMREANDILSFSLPSTSVLDDGCGTGSVTKVLRTYTSSAPILAIDISPGMVEILANKAIPGVRTQVADALDLRTHLGSVDGSDGRYSHVLSTFMVQFTTDAHQAVREMHRVLRPQGLLGLATWGELEMYRLFKRVCQKLDSEWVFPDPISKQWPVEESGIVAAIEEMGFKSVKSWKMRIEAKAQGEDGLVEYALSGRNPANEVFLRRWRDIGRFQELKDAMMKTVRDDGIEVLVNEAMLVVAQKV